MGDAGPTDPGAALGLHLQWRTEALPPGVTTAWTPADEAPDDPTLHPPVTSDPAWDAAVTVLQADPEFVVRRALLDGIDLHVVVRETDEATLTAYPADGATTAVALVLPAADHRGPDGAALPVPERTEVHLDAVVTLVVETQSALGLAE